MFSISHFRDHTCSTSHILDDILPYLTSRIIIRSGSCIFYSSRSLSHMFYISRSESFYILSYICSVSHVPDHICTISHILNIYVFISRSGSYMCEGKF